MKFINVCLVAFLVFFAGQTLALSVNDWVYEPIKGNLKPTAGCKNKEKAAKQASTGYRFKKYTKELCLTKGYGWGIDKVIDRGELVCEPCEGDYENTEKYRCYMANVTVNCKIIKRGF